VPGLPEAAAAEGLSPLGYMRRYGAFEVKRDVYELHRDPSRAKPFGTPSGKLEIYSPTLREWGWPEHAMPGVVTSHVARTELGPDEMVLVPTFRLATLIHSRSANAQWLYEISHKNPLWLHPSDAERLGVTEADLVRVETEIGHFVLRPFVTEGLLPGIVACSHHLGRWRRPEDVEEGSGWASAPVEISVERRAGGKGDEVWRWRRRADPGGDPDALGEDLRWWRESGVHQNLTFPVHPDPISGMHCWHQKVRVRKAATEDRFGDIEVDRQKAREVYRRWRALTRPPTGELRRPLWLSRAVRPADETYRL
jgi:anaerobic selenocysteine-containing dehydrogenase